MKPEEAPWPWPSLSRGPLVSGRPCSRAGEALWPVRGWWDLHSELAGLESAGHWRGWPWVLAFAEEGSERGEEGGGPDRGPLLSLEVRLVFRFGCLLDVVLVGKAWVATEGARSETALSSFGCWSLPSWPCPSCTAVSGTFLRGRCRALVNRNQMEHLDHRPPPAPRSHCSGWARPWVTLPLVACSFH